MSRNLCQTGCYFCDGAVVLEEEPRPIEPHEANRYYDEYRGMPVAKAHCFDCEAKYLAWCAYPDSIGHRPAVDGQRHIDLSFRSTFNDEPGRFDLPVYEIRTVRQRVGLFMESDSWWAQRFRERENG